MESSSKPAADYYFVSFFSKIIISEIIETHTGYWRGNGLFNQPVF